MRCPRCKAEVTGRAARCPRCGAPLALREEPVPGPLDRDLSLDRRGGGPRTTPPFWSPGQTAAPPVAPGEPIEAGFEILGSIEELPGEAEVPELPAPDGTETEPGRPPPPAPAPAPAPAALAERPRPHQVPLPFPPPARLVPAPALRRAAAGAADGALAAALAWLLVAGGARLAGADGAGTDQLPAAAALAALLHFVHATLGHALAGRTLGKWMAGLAVAGPDGRRPGPGRAAARALLSLVAAAPLGLGLLPVLLGRSGRALHDRLARTTVFRAP